MNTATLSIIIESVDRGARVAIKGIGDEAKRLGTEGSTAVAGMRTRLNELDQSGQVTLGTFTNLAGVTFAGTVAGFAALSSGMVVALKHASDLNETTNKFNTTFAGMTGQAETWATELQSSYGMSKNSSMDMLASLQVLNQGMGMSQGEAGKLSNDMIKLAVDLGSFNNLPTTDVLNAMRSALVGEYDPIQRFAGAINAAAVEQKALAMHLAATKDEITAADKAQAMYQLVLESNTKAVGDFIKTSDGLANQTKIFQSNIEDLSGAFGTRLLPVAADVMKNINEGLTSGKGGVDGLSETISVKLLQALGMAVETMRFFHNGWNLIQLAGTLAIEAIAQSVKWLSENIWTYTLKPLDLAFDGLVKLGALEVNPFEGASGAIDTFATSSHNVTAQVTADIASTNASYDNIKTTINGYIDMVKNTGPATATASATAVAANTAVAASSQKVLDAQSKLHDKLAKDMAKNAEEQVRLVVWADGVTRDTITSQYDRKLVLLNMEYEAAKKTAGHNITLLQEVETWHKASIARLQSYDEQYSKADQKRLEGMKDTFMVLEEQKIEASNQSFAASEKAYEKLTSFVTSSKQTEVEIWREASDKEIAELARLSDGTQEYTDRLNDYKETKDREYHAKLQKQTKENLTEMDKLWQDFGHDIHNNFTDVVSAGLHGEFTSIGDAWKGLTDSMLESFLDLIAKLIVAWAEAEIISWWTGSESTFSVSGPMGAKGGSSGSSSAGGTIGGLATTAVTAAAKDYIWTNGVKPVATAAYEAASGYVFGSGAAGATGAAAASGGSIASGTATPAILDAYATYGATTAASTTAGTTAAVETSAVVTGSEVGAGAAAGAGISSTATIAGGYIGLILAFAMMMTNDAMPTLTETFNKAKISVDDLSAAAGPSLTDHLGGVSTSLTDVSVQFNDFSAVSLSTADNMMIGAIEMRNADTNMVEGLTWVMKSFDEANGVWVDSTGTFNSMVAQIAEIGPTTDSAISATAAYVAEMNGIPSAADELAIAYSAATLGTEYFAESVALAGGAFVNAAGAVISGVDMVNAAASGIDVSGFVSEQWAEEGHNSGNNQGSISTPATDSSYYELTGRAEGGVVSRLLVPNGDDGFGALKLGEGVIDADTMKILSAQIRSGGIGGSSELLAAVKELIDEVRMGNYQIAKNTQLAAKKLSKFDRQGLGARV